MLGLTAGAATMGSNAKATTKGAMMLLTNFVFISVIPSVVLAFFDFSLLRTHFWPSPMYCAQFGQVLRGKLASPVRIVKWLKG